MIDAPTINRLPPPTREILQVVVTCACLTCRHVIERSVTTEPRDSLTERIDSLRFGRCGACEEREERP